MIALIAVVGGDDEVAAAREALAGATAGLAFFEGAVVESWTSASGRTGAVWVRSIGVHSAPSSSWTSSGRAAFVLGQPIRWRDGRADGVEVLDAERMATEVFHRPGELAKALDGRGAIVMVGEQAVEVVGDPMHSYPLYARGRGGAGTALWVTNLPGALRRFGGPEATLVRSRMASAVAYGSSFDGAPWLRGVERLGSWANPGPVPRGVQLHSAAPTLARLVASHGRGDIHPADAGAVLVEVTRAMALRTGVDDLIVPVSAGKDSRLILAAALAADLPVRTVTGGADDSADMIAGRRLAEAARLAHQRVGDTQPTRSTDPLDTTRLVSRVSEGVVTAADAHFFPHRPSDLTGTWLSGQAGEIARAFYGRPLGPATPTVLMLRAMSRRPRRPLPLTPLAELGVAREVRGRIGSLRRAGAGPATIGDVFYLTDRMGRHLSGALLHFELGLDYASPLWSSRLLPYLWAGTTAERGRSAFHDRVTEALVAGQSPAVQDAFREAIHGGASKEAPVEPGGVADDALLAIQHHLRSLAGQVPAGDPLWKTLSRRRTLALAERSGSDLDFIERQHVWRLATALQSWTG